MARTIDPRRIPASLCPIMEALCTVGIDLADRIAMGGLAGDMAASMGTNTDGDGQKALDLIADDAFHLALRGTGIRYYASEEQQDVAEIDTDGAFALAIDPLDGSSNIDVNVSIGTIFSIFPAAATTEESFLRPARDQIAAGFVIYGPQTNLVVTFGDGAFLYVLDRAKGRFVEAPSGPIQMPAASQEFAINASNYRHWPDPVRAYIDDCLAGAEGPRARDYNMRWVASLVAEAHRIITRGGIFLYPSDKRPGYQSGRLRMVYECAPIAFLVEQAGGAATDGMEPILTQAGQSLHARTPFVFGSPEKVGQLAVYHDLPPLEAAALFANRGLFRK